MDESSSSKIRALKDNDRNALASLSILYKIEIMLNTIMLKSLTESYLNMEN